MKIRKKLQLIRMVLLLIVAVCIVQIGHTYYLSEVQKKKHENLLRIVREAEEETLPQNVEDSSLQDNMDISLSQDRLHIGPDADHEGIMLDKLKKLYEENNDLAGWISIPGTAVDYPVMQHGDNQYYLSHDFFGNEDRYGCLFVKDIADVNTPGTNFIIYGHSMWDGSMFGSLEKYKSESYCMEHSTIYFDTLYEKRTYEVMAVFLSKVYKEDDDVFKYYQFYQADSEEEFRMFYENIMEMSLYDTGVTAQYGDTFLMLSTCAYHEEDGRLVVVAKKKDS